VTRKTEFHSGGRRLAARQNVEEKPEGDRGNKTGRFRENGARSSFGIRGGGKEGHQLLQFDCHKH